MRTFTLMAGLGLWALIVSACAAPSATLATPDSTSTPGAPSPGAMPAPTTAPPPPRAASEFTTDFSQHNVPYDEISEVVPKDRIPAIDEPTLVSIEEADGWLASQEPVLTVQISDEARAYPIQILMWHEIVNDVVGDTPVAVTYCPLCNTGIAFERDVDGRVLDFGTTGRLRHSNLIMYDRQTESWWQQATGEAIAGQFTDRQLTFVPTLMVSWSDFKAAYPDGRVLSRDTGHRRAYGQNPYVGYDAKNGTPFLYDGPETPDVLPSMARVVAIDLNDEAVAYPYDVLEEVRVVNDAVGGTPVAVFWSPGTASALDASSIVEGDDVGSATTFSRELDGRTLTFVFEDGRIIDAETGTAWDVLGWAISGPQAGERLSPIVSVNYFWFSWAAFKPETRVYGADVPSSGPEAPSKPASAGLEADVEINLCQGEDVLAHGSFGLACHRV